MVRDDLPTESNPFDEPLPFLEPKANGQHRLDELPDDWSDFDLQQIDTAHGAADNGQAANAQDAGDSSQDQDFIVGGNTQQTDGYIEQRKHAKTTRTVVIVVVALLVIVGLVFGFVSGAFANLFKSEPEPQLVASSESAPPVTEINVEADGYDEQASPIVYHLVGGPSGDSAAHVDRYGIVPAPSGASKSGTTAGNNALKVSFDDLPEGSYTVTWSTSFLSDGSILRAPDETIFKVSRGDVALSVEFERVDAADVSAEEAREAYEQLDEWLSGATRDVANRRDAILETARRNAETAPAVAAAGGLDGNARETEREANSEESQNQGQQQTVAVEQVVEQAADQGAEADSEAEAAGDQDEAAGGDAGDAGDGSGGSSGGNVEPEPTPEPAPAVEPEPAPPANSGDSAAA